MGVTPLHIATRKGFNSIVADLIRAGADPQRLDLLGQSPLDYANAKTKAVIHHETTSEEAAPQINDEEDDLTE